MAKQRKRLTEVEVLDMLHLGHTSYSISKSKKRSEKYVESIIKTIDEQADSWLRLLSKTTFVASYQQDLTDIYKLRKEYNAMLAELNRQLEKKDLSVTEIRAIIQTKTQVAASLNNNIKDHWDLLDRAPMVAAHEKFVKDNIMHTEKPKGEVCDELPFLPDLSTDAGKV